MSEHASVSIALAVKNGLPHLRDAIEGLQRQTYRNFELFVQDSVSTDGSVEYLESITSFPVHIVSEPDESLVNGYNRALQRCMGDLVIAAACDEVLNDDAIEKFVAWHHEHPDAVFIYSGVRLIGGVSSEPREFVPPPFNFIDYIRHEMCPAISASVFNRHLLGKELYLDETLKCVPDFELITRMALRFGPERLVRKEDIIVTARADAVSMSYRPESFEHVAHAKTIVIDRLLGLTAGVDPSGGVHREFLHFLRRDIVANMHASFAKQIFDLVGDAPVFREHVMIAHRNLPSLPIVQEVVGRTRHLEVDRTTHQISERRNVQPRIPPKNSVNVVRALSGDLMNIEPHWASAGANQVRHFGQTIFETPRPQWSYAAMAPLGISDLSIDQEWHWVRVSVSDVSGSPMLSLFNAGSNELFEEVALSKGEEPREYYFEVRDGGYDSLLLRNGHADGASSVAVRAIEILSMPIRPEYAEP